MSNLSPEAIVATGVREKAVSFTVEGQQINGILATPEKDAPRRTLAAWLGLLNR